MEGDYGVGVVGRGRGKGRVVVVRKSDVGGGVGGGFGVKEETIITIGIDGVFGVIRNAGGVCFGEGAFGG